MLPTPDTSHLSFSAIYEPAEDSFLLLDTLSAPSEITYLHDKLGEGPSPLVLEVGTGSGVVLAFLAANAKTLCGREDVVTLGVDVSHAACKGAAVTVQRNAPDASFLDTTRADLTSSIRLGTVDVLIFNPPYVPSEELPQVSIADVASAFLSSSDRFEHESSLLALATDGGQDGMEVTNRLLEQIPSILSERGVAYVLLCAQNRPDRVKQGIKLWGPEWNVRTVRTSGKQGGWEKLQIVRIARSHMT